MELYKISKLSSNPIVSKFVARRWIEVNDLSGTQYSVNKNIRFRNPTRRSDFPDTNNANIVVKETITVEGTNPGNRKNKMLTFKKIALFRLCISKIHTTFMDNAEDLDIVMLM